MRTILPQQKHILDEKQELIVGVFEDYFVNFNLLTKKRSGFKNIKNKSTLTEWQAVEVLQGDLFLISAVFKFGPMNKTLMLLYDIFAKELYNFSSDSIFKNVSMVAPSLEGKSHSYRMTDESTLNVYNQLEKEKIYVDGKSKNLMFDVEAKRIAKPSVVSIPMDSVHTVYTEKDLLQPIGYIQFNDKEYKLNDRSIAILDDHRGYYPMSSGYDWVTCMGDLMVEDRLSKFGVNLTYFYKNLDQDKYCENGYWLNGEFNQLPVVKFKRTNDIWAIKDDHDIVNLTFKNYKEHTEKRDKIFKIDYTLAFGEISGTIKTAKGILSIDKMFALGEKRITQLFNQEYKD